MRAEREKLNAKITAGSLRMTSGQLELPAESCHIILFSGGSCTVRCGDTALLVSPGCVLLLGPGAWVVSQAGHALPEMLGCGFPLHFHAKSVPSASSQWSRFSGTGWKSSVAQNTTGIPASR